jgi:ADP-heptose:LPS heptosyltransferase
MAMHVISRAEFGSWVCRLAVNPVAALLGRVRSRKFAKAVTLRMRLLWWLVVMAPFDWLACRANAKSKVSAPTLALVRVDALGDFALWLDAAKEIRRLYPAHRIVLVANRMWAGFARSLGYFDEVWEVDLRAFALNPYYRFRTVRRLAATSFDLTLNPTYTRDFIWDDALSRATGATTRVGFKGSEDNADPRALQIANDWYTRLIVPYDGPATELERNAEFVRALGVAQFGARVPLLRLSGEESRVRQPLYLIFPGAGRALRQWPSARFAALACKIYERTKWRGAICGGSKDAPLAIELRAAAPEIPIEDFTGKTSLTDLMSLIARANLVITNESGPLHLAAISRVPTICIMGGGHYGRFLPYPPGSTDEEAQPKLVIQRMSCFGCCWNCIYPIHRGDAAPCIDKVSVEDVWAETSRLIDRLK